MKSHTKLYVAALIVIQLLVLLYFGSMKKGMHFDECFSYFNTNNSVGRQAFDRTFVTSEDILKDFYVKAGEQFNYGYVIKLQSYDVHPPFFYLLLHTVCSFMPGVFSLWQGIGLNVLYSIVASVFLFLILKTLTNNNELVAFVITLMTAINTGVISNAMYIRMYCLMTMLIIIAIYLHIRMVSYECINSLPWQYIVLNAILAYLGFMTHYFYLLFLFFLEAAYILPMCLKLKTNIKGIIKYCTGLLLAGILGVLLYPSCLGHVNSGYRGNEVKSYLVNMSDFAERFSFFGNLIDKYVFNGFLSVYLLLLIMLLLMTYYKKRISVKAENISTDGLSRTNITTFIRFIVIPSLGYYIVSVKGSLMGDEAMMRYQLPIYGLIYAAFIYSFYATIKYIINNPKRSTIISLILGIILLIVAVRGLVIKNVFYLYEEVEYMEDMAAQYSNNACVYIYNGEANKYRLWNDALQLAKYDQVYFIDSDNLSAIEEPIINDADSLVVYVSIFGQRDSFDTYANLIFENNTKVNSYSKLYDAMCAEVYIFE